MMGSSRVHSTKVPLPFARLYLRHSATVAALPCAHIAYGSVCAGAMLGQGGHT